MLSLYNKIENMSISIVGGAKMTLLILAAGLGSRYGGLKQLEPVTDNGEFIIDFSVHDAVRAGFDRIVFVIKEENLSAFRETVGSRFERRIRVEYAFQRMDDLPAGYRAPTGREKPWGTAHALLAARHIIDEPFAVINADDFYGRSAYRLLAEHLSSVTGREKRSPYCMVGYSLGNTLTENGSVARGICEVRDGYLTDVVERTKITDMGLAAVYTEGLREYILSFDTTVSMNCWGFTPDVFDRVSAGFAKFLDKHANDRKMEYYLPFAVREIMDRDECTVRVYPSADRWCGVTYREDHDSVVKYLATLKKNGTYPKNLNTIKTEDKQ